MLGGGTFTAQNKKLPGTYINFASASRASASLSDRGIVAIPLLMDWGAADEVFEVSNEKFVNNSLKIFGYDYSHDKMKGLRDLFKNTKTLYAYRLNGKGTKATNTYAEAKYPGIRGNDLKIIIPKNVDDETKFDVKTVLEFKEMDVQTVKNSSELETVTMKDKQVSFTKTDVTGEKEVEGATITVKEKETGKVIDEWTSTKESHFINGLEEDKTYILSETVSPEEYVKSTDIEFTVSKDKVDQKVNMKDKQVIISKSMVGGDEVVGSSMQILDEEGNVVDEWISEGKEHYASNLEEGHTYTLHEDLAPTGLNLANDIVFAVTEEKENQKVEMVDTVNQVSKVKEDGTLLKDAELTVVSTKTKQIVDKWISGQHIFDLTDDMKSQLAENGKAEGKVYVDNEDSTFIYSVSKNKNDYTLMTAKDGVTTYSNIDLDGNETTHRIEGLVAGETYILRETKTPDGYATFEEQEFVADEAKDTLLKMTDEDTKVEVSKQDITTKKELPGAHLKVTDEEGNTVDEWVSKEESHIIKNLVAGKSYTLTETIAPAKYKISESVNFKVEDTGTVQKVVMYDELLPEAAKVVKTGDNTRAFGYVLMALGCFVFALVIFKHKDE